MRLRTKMVGATTLALLGLTLAVQHWAEGPLPQRPFRGPAVQVRPTPLPAALPSPSARPGVHAPSPSPTPPAAHAQPPAAAPAAASDGLAHARDTGGSGHAPPLPSEPGPASPSPGAAPASDEAARREVRALVLAAARELAAKPPAAAASPEVAGPPREAAELQRVPLEAGLPRVELDEAGERVAPIDLSTGAGLEDSPPLPEAAARPPHEAGLVDPEPVLDEPVEGEASEGEPGEGEAEAGEGLDDPEAGPEEPLQHP